MLKKKYPTFEAELEYAKVFEHNRDMGNEKIDLSDTDGRYSVVLIIPQETKDMLVGMGIEEKSLGHDRFKPTGDGRYRYQVYRTHLHKHIKDDDGNPILNGPPIVVDTNKKIINEDGQPDYEPWDPEVLIGNGSTARIKLQLVYGRAVIVNLLKIGIINHVEYIPDAF